MRQRVCVNERDRNNMCKIEIEIMYLDEKEILDWGLSIASLLSYMEMSHFISYMDC